MNVITDMLDYFYTLFYNWNSLDIIILALVFCLFYCLGSRKGYTLGKADGRDEYRRSLFKH